MPGCPSGRAAARLALGLALAVPLAASACGHAGDAGDGDAAMQPGTLADTAALSATAGFVETPSAFTGAGLLAMLDEADQSDSAAAALAIANASNPDVKAFAAAMMQDHHALRLDGEDLAKRLSLTPQLPASDLLAPALDDELLGLRAAVAGPAFDRVYVAKELITHQTIIDFAERAGRSTPNPQIRAYLDQLMPVTRRHLARIQALEKKLGPGA
jgi:predicted outer membrane protein